MPRQLLVIAHHLVWTVYGYWLPNDPRGSNSHLIRNNVLADLGGIHFGRKKVQPTNRELREFYAQATPLLQHPVLKFDEPARAVIASAFADVIAEHKLTCWACVIMHDHVHLLVRKHKLLAEEMIVVFQDASAKRLRELEGWNNHPVWGGPGWKVFLDHPTEVHRTVGYVERNPDSYHLPRQSYPFVLPYDNWPIHPGHHPNSPYVRIMKENGVYPA